MHAHVEYDFRLPVGLIGWLDPEGRPHGIYRDTNQLKSYDNRLIREMLDGGAILPSGKPAQRALILSLGYSLRSMSEIGQRHANA